ncbi:MULTISPECIES: hypothetical protein [unclassified Hyphomicrobium]|uniref:hypothetical protein n=1 Tax=unclassified Hyphomicrobium TaxID=2619925 RepID=UPI000213ED3D|nr:MULTISPECIES: hypothetical protein [unclassified Hyphomicrobium]CCB64791.1 protein of unknown function [Hyphomicrobium sp. MC1]
MAQTTKKPDAPAYPAEKASQGEIILKQPWQRAVFIGGIAAALLLPLIVLAIAR